MSRRSLKGQALALAGSLFIFPSCAALFGWDIHAPGLLSQGYFANVQTLQHRLALYITPGFSSYTSTDRGGRFADPQTYHVGEAYQPMVIEGFQHAFEEFIYVEAEPDPAIMKQYGIPYLAVVETAEFYNRVTMKGQAVELVTRIHILNQDLETVETFEVSGSSDAQKIFSKKGGPEMNLNAALERNITATVQHIHDSLRTGAWQEK